MTLRRPRAGHRRLPAFAVVVALCCAAPSSAAPGLISLGGPQIGLHATEENVGAVVVHRGAVHAAVIERASRRTMLQVQRLDQRFGAWLPVAGTLNAVDADVGPTALLSTRAGELYAAWIEVARRSSAARVVVARLMAGDGGWERVLVARARALTVRLAQVGNDVWLGWTDHGVQIARITARRAERVNGLASPPGARLQGLVGYGDVAYMAYTATEVVPAHRDRTGNRVAQRQFDRVGLLRLSHMPDTANVRVSDLGAWDDVGFGVFLTTGAPDEPTRPVLGWNTLRGIELRRMRADGRGLVPVDLAPVIALRRLANLRGLIATPAGIAIAAEGGLDARIRVYTIAGAPPADLSITEGEQLPQADGREVSMAPATPPDGGIVIAYNTRASRSMAMRYSP